MKTQWLAVSTLAFLVGCGAAADNSGTDEASEQSGESEALTSNATYNFGTAVHAGSCMDIAAASTADGAQIQEYTCNGTSAQIFQTIALDATYFKLVNPVSGKCVDIAANATANGSKVDLYTCNGTSAQAFKFVASGSSFTIVGKQSGRCLDVTAASTANGTKIDLYDCNGTKAQLWTATSTTSGSGGSGGASGSGGNSGGSGGSTGGVGGSAGGVTVGPTGLLHPGILVNRGMLDFVKGKLTTSAAPWAAALSKAESSFLGSKTYKATPHANVECGPSSNPDIGCTDEKNDAAAAYTQALLWYYTGNKTYATNAINIMNAWSAVLTQHTFDNAQLQASWAAEVFVRGAEIIRYSNAGWSPTDIAQFTKMLNTAYLPLVKDGSTRTGNWDTSAIEAAMNIAIFTDDKTEFDKTVSLWRARTPAYVYLSTDGAQPVQPPRVGAMSSSGLAGYWYNPKKYLDGMTQESCRDLPNSGTQGFGHAQYGMAGIINAAETARIQGVNLFAEQEQRLTAMLEFHAKYLNGASTSALCNTQIAGVSADPMWEIGYNAYANVLGASLPQTLSLVQKIRPTDATHHMAFETLTHANIGSAGL